MMKNDGFQTLAQTAAMMKSASQNLNEENLKYMNARAERDRAILQTADNTNQINDKVKSIDESLIKEQKIREKADKQNHDESEKWHKIDFTIGLLGLLVGIAGVIVAIFH